MHGKHSISRSVSLIAAICLMALPGASPFAAEMDDMFLPGFKLEQFERRFQDGEDVLVWDAHASYSNDLHKFALLNEGEYALDENRTESSEWQLRYGRMVSDFFDAHLGLRYDEQPKPDRTYLVMGASGLAPQWVELDANLFVSEEGEATARIEGEYDLKFTQRLILQAEGELDLAFGDDPEIGQGSGINKLEIGLRLRYEITREFAPYIGLSYERLYGDTADFAREEGDETEATALVAGVTFWF